MVNQLLVIFQHPAQAEISGYGKTERLIMAVWKWPLLLTWN
jgi:hypothetical protein